MSDTISDASMGGTTMPKTDGSNGYFGDELKHEALEAGTKAKEKVGEAVQNLTDKAESIGAEQKGIGAEQINDLAGAVHVAAQQLEQKMPDAASFVHSTADRLSGAAVALRERSVGQLLNDIGDFARREPTLFFGARWSRALP